MGYEYPTIQQFKDFFVRDFPYGTDPAIAITDQDIGNAFQLTNVNFSECFYADQSGFNIGYFLLAAHNLVTSLQASSQGMSGQFNWNESSKSVGSVSQSFDIPQRIKDDPNFAWLTKTNYGARYLMLILPQLTGQIFSVLGSTRP